MTDLTGQPATVRMVRTMHPAARLILAGFGIFALVTPAISFGPALFQPTLFVLPFWIITIGAGCIGGTILLGVTAGDDTILEVEDGRIHLGRRNPLCQSVTVLAREDILAVAVHTVEWDSGPDTFAVEVTLRRGHKVGSDDFRNRAEAEALAARLEAALGRT